jgi:hypothetical protein
MEINKMKRIKIIGLSMVSFIVIILASLSNVVGYQTVQSSNQNRINNTVDQRELLFETIVDIANNKEIQQIILKSQIKRDGLFYPDEKLSTFNTFIVTKNQIKRVYFIGLLFTGMLSKSKMQSILEQNRFSNQEMQNEITAIIEKDATLDMKVTQLLNSECDCDNEQTSSWGFPILCSILNVLMIIPIIVFALGSSLEMLALWFRLIGLIGYVMTLISLPIIYAIINLGTIFDCNWWFIST